MNSLFYKPIISFYQSWAMLSSHKHLMPCDVKSQLDSDRGPAEAQTDTDLTHSLRFSLDLLFELRYLPHIPQFLQMKDSILCKCT